MSFKGFYCVPYQKLTRAALPDGDLLARVRSWQKDVPPDEKHWEFVAMALLATAGYPATPVECGSPLHDALIWLYSQMKPGHPAANWRLMRAITKAAVTGRVLRCEDLASPGVRPEPNGYLPDLPGDISTQYHAYLAHLLAQFGDAKDLSLQTLIRNALAWLVTADAEDGDPNGQGRGAFQLFGYVSMAALAALAKHRWSLTTYEPWHARVRSRITYAPDSGALPLVWDTPIRNQMLWGYNTPEDYPAFAAFWLSQLSADAKQDAFTLENGTGPVRFFLLTTPQGNACVFEARRGPLITLSPTVAPAQEPGGLKTHVATVRACSHAVVREIWRRVRKQHAAAPRIRVLGDMPFTIGGWAISCQGEQLFFEAVPVGTSRFATPDVISYRPTELSIRFPTPEGIEITHHAWWRTAHAEDTLWRGLSARFVRKGNLTLTFEALPEK